MQNIRKYTFTFLRGMRWMLYFIACVFILFISLAFTDIPYYWYHGYVKDNQSLTGDADFIIVMSGNNFPSSDAIEKIYLVSKIKQKRADTKIILAFPALNVNSIKADSLFFKNYGIDNSNLIISAKGYNTMTQVENILLENSLTGKNIIVVCNYEQTRRTLACFRKRTNANFIAVYNIEKPFSPELLSPENNDSPLYSLQIRYNFWNYLIYQIKAMREYIAIQYYTYKNWI